MKKKTKKDNHSFSLTDYYKGMKSGDVPFPSKIETVDKTFAIKLGKKITIIKTTITEIFVEDDVSGIKDN